MQGSPAEREPVRLVVGEEHDGERCDRFIAASKLASRSEAQRWILDGRVTRGGKTLLAKTKVCSGDELDVIPAPPPTTKALPEDLPIDICYEDDHLLIVNKASGMVVHPAAGHPSGTLVNALLHHTEFRDESGDPHRPGIVHRLDKDTSGVMVVAKSRLAREGLVKLFAAHDIQRRYDAIVVGRIRSTTFDTFHGRHPRHRMRFSSKVTEGKRAVTHMKSVEMMALSTRVECRLETGRTHQIRVHLADQGSPVLADATYGRRYSKGPLAEASAALGRQALHAGVLGFVHPVSGEEILIEAPLPACFNAALEILRR
jgi:23S rRNA pseudouridine1911/1915/1917 synthase